ncbi:putative protein phosphatase 2C 1 [Camellia lanceoleosa]|uniref:Uncharacterized protein n=1 Tax=Camellia lanceoleosa TaxID=1840588 RepID=A0ACC0G905_9ERIC|nr:putative protein phosphatase 2C 1 [Camellia lanceoleosa]
MPHKSRENHLYKFYVSLSYPLELLGGVILLFKMDHTSSNFPIVDPSLFSRELMAKASDLVGDEEVNYDPQILLKKAHAATSSVGSATVIVAMLERNGSLKIANVGDCGLRVIRKGQIIFSTSPQEHYFDCPYQLSSEVVDVCNTDMFGFSIYILCTKALANLAHNHSTDSSFDSPYSSEARTKTTASKSGALRHDIHYWLGKDTNQDEAGDIHYWLGKDTSQHAEAQEHKTWLYACKGKHVVHVKEVSFARSSLNYDDIFILDTKSKIFQFNGSNSFIQERAKALEVVQYIKDTYHDGKCEVAAIAIFAAISAMRARADVAYCIHALARQLSKTHNWASQHDELEAKFFEERASCEAK